MSNLRIKESYSWLCSDIQTKDIEANLNSFQNTDIYNHINTLTDKNIKQALQYAYSNQTVNSTINDTLTEQSLSSVVSTINKLVQQNTVNFVMTNSSEIKNITVNLDNNNVQKIVSDYKTWSSALAQAAIQKVTDRMSGNSSDISDGASASTDNSASSFAGASEDNKQSGDQEADSKEGYRRSKKPIIYRRVVGEPYFPRRGLLVSIAEAAQKRKEACGGLFNFADSNYNSMNESLNSENQQITNIDQAITQNVYEDYDMSSNFDIALSSITESVNKTKTSNVTSSSVEALNEINSSNTANITIDGVTNVDGINISLTNEGAQSIQSFALVANVLVSELTTIEKGIVMDLLGLVAHQQIDSSTDASSDASSSSSMSSTQEIEQKEVSKKTNTVAIIILIVIIILIIFIACFASRDKDPVFDPHGGKSEKDDYDSSDVVDKPKEKVEVPVEVEYVPTIENAEVTKDI